MPNLSEPTTSELTITLSPDELSGYFASNAAGNLDLYELARASRAEPFTIVGPATSLNSGGTDVNPTLAPDGLLLVFASDRCGGPGGYDLWQAARSQASDPFDAPTPVTALNTASDDLQASFEPGGAELYFSSTRSGAGQSLIYRSVLAGDLLLASTHGRVRPVQATRHAPGAMPSSR